MNKKIIAFTLLIGMLFAVSSFTVSADAAVCYIVEKGEGTKYTTVADAVSAASSGNTIMMIANSKETAYISFGTKSITIDGGENKYTIDSTGVKAGYQFGNTSGNAGQCVTLKNLQLEHDGGFWLRPLKLSIENCVINTKDGNAFYLADKKNVLYDINIVGCKWYADNDSGSSAFARMGMDNLDSNGSFKVTDSTIEYVGGTTDNGNNSMFYCNTLGSFSFSIRGNSEIVLSGDQGAPFFYVYDAATHNILLDDGVKVTFISENDTMSFINDNSTVHITDNGAVWMIERSSEGVLRLPVTDTDNINFIGRKLNGHVYSPDVKEFSVIGNTIIDPFILTSEDFKMIEGATLRYGDGETGLRFTTTVSDRLYDTLGDTASFGTVVVPLSEGETFPIEDTSKPKLVIERTKWDTEYSEGARAFHGTVIMVPSGVAERAIYELRLSAVAYITVTYADGAELTLYTDFDIDKNTASMKELAIALEYPEDGKDRVSNTLTRRILEICEVVEENGEVAG